MAVLRIGLRKRGIRLGVYLLLAKRTNALIINARAIAKTRTEKVIIDKNNKQLSQIIKKQEKGGEHFRIFSSNLQNDFAM